MVHANARRRRRTLLFFSCAITVIFFLLYPIGDGSDGGDGINHYIVTTTPTPRRGNEYNRTAHPGRFKMDTYPNVTVSVKYSDNPNAVPLGRSDCAPGLTCEFSDKSWHEVKFQTIIEFANSPKELNKVYITRESPGRFTMNVPDNKRTNLHGGPFAGLALTTHTADIPLSYLNYQHDNANIESIKQPVSDEIVIWRILHIASNCDYVYSGRNNWVQALIDRGLVDSFGKCHVSRELSLLIHVHFDVHKLTHSSLPYSTTKIGNL